MPQYLSGRGPVSKKTIVRKDVVGPQSIRGRGTIPWMRLTTWNDCGYCQDLDAIRAVVQNATSNTECNRYTGSQHFQNKTSNLIKLRPSSHATLQAYSQHK